MTGPRAPLLRFALLLLATALAACVEDSEPRRDTASPDPGHGDVTVVVHPGPPLPGAPIGAIELRLSGPHSPRSAELTSVDNSTTFEGLVAGTWSARATATQAGCESTCEGEVQFEVIPGEHPTIELPMRCDEECANICFDPGLPAAHVPGGDLEALVRILHLVGGAGALEVFLNGDPTSAPHRPLEPLEATDADDLLYFDITLYGEPEPPNGYGGFPVPGGSFDYGMRFDDGQGASFEAEVPLEACEATTLALIGQSGSTDFPPQLLPLDDHAVRASTGMQAVSVVHAWPSSDRLDLWTCMAEDIDLDGVADPCDTTTPPGVTDLGFGEHHILADEPPGTRVLTLARTGEQDVLSHHEWAAQADGWAYLYLWDEIGTSGRPLALWHEHRAPLVELTP